MPGFISLAKRLQALIEQIILSPAIHIRWLNTLSYLENCGAKKIAAAEHPLYVKEEMLKHAAEEFRHALHLKRQIQKISNEPLPHYASSMILGGETSRHYLNRLDIQGSRHLKNQGLEKQTAYILVTYAIERRADELYRIYHEVLKKSASKVTVACIFF